jgi:hypothetical protein
MYALDTEAAKAADSTGSRISERGKYKGQFTRAQHIVADSGTKGIDFDFTADNGQKARFSVYTVKSDGTKIYGLKQLMAIMTVLKLRNLADPVNTPAKIYDYDQSKEVDAIVPQFAELLNKPIGLLLTMEEYKPGKWRPNLSGIFQAETELVASEILDRKTHPQTLAKMVERLQDKPMKATQPAAGTASSSTGPADMDDDIPW